MVYMTDIFEQNVDYQKLDAFAQNVTSSLINSTTTTSTTSSAHNTTGIPGVGENIIHSILSVPMLGGATAGFLLGFMLT